MPHCKYEDRKSMRSANDGEERHPCFVLTQDWRWYPGKLRRGRGEGGGAKEKATQGRSWNRKQKARYSEEDNRAPLLLHSAQGYRLLTLCGGLCPGETSLSSLVTSTSLLNVSISPRLLVALRELSEISSGLPEFCRKDKMHMLLLLQGSVFGNEQSPIVMQVTR